MNKPEFAKELKAELGLPNIDEAIKIIDGYHATVTKLLHEGESINLVGFGKYSVLETNERTMKHPQSTTENPLPDVQVKAGHKPKFSFSKKVKDLFKD